MKKLYLIRHAKSSWKDMTLKDFDRPLNSRGKQNAPFMGNILKERNISPDLILSSPAKRAKKTAKIIANMIEYPHKITYDKKIYDYHFDELDEIVHSIDDKYDSVFLVGHNPSLNIFVDDYVGFLDNIPTCGIVAIEFDVRKWKKISAKKAKIDFFIYPKMFTKE
jgi:phosphohistidine phosphatase